MVLASTGTLSLPCHRENVQFTPRPDGGKQPPRGLLDTITHPNLLKYPNQSVFVMVFEEYVYLVPFVEEAEFYFLKTVIPSRKATRDYLQRSK